MPGFDTHYIFGLQTYQELEDKHLRHIIRNHHTVYGLGLQGPDLFFYDLLGHLKKDINLGELAHDHSCGLFLKNLKDSIDFFPDTYDKEVALVYYLGFLGHHELDSVCHPYVYAFTNYDPQEKNYFDRHLKLETDIDTVMLHKYLKKNPSHFKQARTIDLVPSELSVVSAALYYAFTKTYPDALITKKRMMRAILSFHFNAERLHDPSGEKKRFLVTLEQFVPGHMLFSGIIARNHFTYNGDPCNFNHLPWTNLWTGLESTDSFVNLFDDAKEHYLKVFSIAGKYFSSDKNSSESLRLEEALLSEIGNKSYISGMESL